MSVWSSIYNIIALLLLLFISLVLLEDIREIERDFEDLRLRYAVDYATEGAFISTLDGGRLGVSYQDLQNIRLNPSNALETFKTIIALSYDMSLSKDNLSSLDAYISSAVLATADGYYIATPQEVHSGRTGVSGGEYKLMWGMKKPYTIMYTSTSYVAYNLSTERWFLARQSGNNLILDQGEEWSELRTKHGYEVGVSNLRDKIVTQVNATIMEDINYNIRKRNDEMSRFGSHDFIYLPTQQTQSGVNPIEKPSLLISLSNVDFAGTQLLEAQSVGGFTVAKKRRVLGFVEDGERYYAFEGQLDSLDNVENFYNTVDQAALDGYRPHVGYLKRPLTRE